MRYFFLIILTMLFISCGKHTFKLHTHQFRLFQNGAAPASPSIKKFQEGIYLFPLQMEPLFRDGITYNWYKNLPLKGLLEQEEKPVAYAYFVFLDHERVYYYSSYKDGWRPKIRQIKTKCVQEPCISPAMPREFSENKPMGTSFDTLPGIHDHIIINNQIGNFVLRGYYQIKSTPSGSKLVMELERPDTKKKVKTINRKKKQGPKTNTFEFTFELVEDKFVMEKFEIKRYGQVRSINNINTIFPSSTFSIQPTFEFVPLKVKFLYRDHDRVDHHIVDIQYSNQRDTAYYYTYPSRRIEEHRLNEKYLMSW